jgi:hypothetical protein
MARHFRLLCAAAVALGASAASRGVQLDAELTKAREKFTRPPEQECLEAVEICVRRNSATAVALMLDVLRVEHDRGPGFRAAAYYRDIAWGGLERITDGQARAAVDAELANDKDSALVRQWCAELLGEYGDAAFGASLTNALGDKDLGVRRAAARALGQVRATGAVAALTALARDKDAYLRANAIEALVRIDRDANRAALAQALADKDGSVRCALLAAALDVYGEDAEGWSIAALQDGDWRPRMQAVDNLGRVRTKTSVDALIAAAARSDRTAVLERVTKRLQELTGQKLRSAEEWKAWWQQNREHFVFGDKLAQASREGQLAVKYHGLDVLSDHVAFLIDKTEDMKSLLKMKVMSKNEAALKELDGVLSKLQTRTSFDVLTYADAVRALEPHGPLALDAKTHKKALEFVDKAPEGKHRNVWSALEAAVSDPELDTAFLLTAGEADVGLYVRWNRIGWQLKELDRFHKVVVNAIAFGEGDAQRQQVAKITEATGGEFYSFE